MDNITNSFFANLNDKNISLAEKVQMIILIEERLMEWDCGNNGISHLAMLNTMLDSYQIPIKNKNWAIIPEVKLYVDLVSLRGYIAKPVNTYNLKSSDFINKLLDTLCREGGYFSNYFMKQEKCLP